MILLRILLAILIIILILLILILLIPYKYRIKSDNIREKIEVRVSCLFGIFKISYLKYMDKSYKDEFILSIFNLSKKIDSSGGKSKTTKNKDKKEKRKRSISLSKVTKTIVDRAILLSKRIWRHIRPRHISADLKFGFNDPMYTGLVYGLYCSLSHLLGRDFQLSPNFDEEEIRGGFQVIGEVWMFYILIAFLKFIFSPPVRKEIKFNKNKRRDASYVR